MNLLKYLISHHSKTKDTVLDLFSGTGSTAEAALLCNRNVISVESDSNQAAYIKSRLNKITELISDNWKNTSSSMAESNSKKTKNIKNQGKLLF